MAALRPCDDLQKKAFDETTAILNADPEREAHHGHLHPGRPGRGRGRQAGRPRRRQGDRPGPAQRQQAGMSTRGSPTASSSGRPTTSATSPSWRPGPSPRERSSPATRSSHAGRLGTLADRGRQHPARQAVHVQQGEHRSIRFLRKHRRLRLRLTQIHARTIQGRIQTPIRSNSAHST